MKIKQDGKNFHIGRLLVTVFISAAIIGLGFLIFNSIRYWIPTYKNNMTYMKEENVQMQPLYWKREEAITIYPWALYKDNLILPLTDEDKQLLQDAGISALLSMAAFSIGQPDFISSFEKVTVNNYSVYFLKNYECSGYQMSERDMEVVTDDTKSMMSKPSAEPKMETVIINCAVDQRGQLLYLHVANKDSIQTPADSKKIEEAYNKFALYKDISDDLTDDKSSLIDNINYFLDLIKNSNQNVAISILEDLVVTDHSSYDVVMQDQQILLIYTLDSGYRVIFIYNVPMQLVVGVSMERLSV